MQLRTQLIYFAILLLLCSGTNGDAPGVPKVSESSFSSASSRQISIDLSGNAVKIGTYVIRYRLRTVSTIHQWNQKIFDATENSLILSGLQGNSEYQIDLQQCNPVGHCSRRSTYFYIPTKPDDIGDVEILLTSETRLLARFNERSGKYVEVYTVNTDLNGVAEDCTTTNKGNFIEIKCENLVAEQKYKLTIKACVKVGKKLLCSNDRFVQFFTGSEVIDVDVSSPGVLNISLTSTNFKNDFMNYKVSYKEPSKSQWISSSACTFKVLSTSVDCKIRPLKINTEYDLRLEICSAKGTCTQAKQWKTRTSIPAPIINSILFTQPMTLIVNLKPDNTASGTFKVKLTSPTAGNSEKQYAAPNAKLTISGLLPSTTYSITIQNCMGTGSGEVCSASSNQMQEKTLPSAPEISSIKTLPAISVEITLTKYEQDKGTYKVYYKEKNDLSKNYIAEFAAPKNSLRIQEHLNGNNIFSFNIQLCEDNTHCSPNSKTMDAVTYPDVLRDVEILLTNETQVLAKFQERKGRNEETYFANTVRNNVKGNCKKSKKENAIYITCANLEANEAYNIVIKACITVSGVELCSSEIHVPFVTGSVKIVVDASTPKELALTLKSTNSANQFSEYKLSYKLSSKQAWTRLSACEWKANSLVFACKIPNLDANTDYDVQLEICSTKGTCTPASRVTQKTLIPAPVINSILVTQPKTLIVHLKPDNTASGTFKVQLTSPTAGISENQYKAPNAQLTISGLLPSTTYSITIQNCMATGSSEVCSASSNAMEETTLPAVPKLTSMNAVLPNSIILTINDAQPEGYFEVTLTPAGEAATKLNFSASESQLKIEDLLFDTAYSVSIKKCESKCSIASNTLSNTTLPAPPTLITFVFEAPKSLILELKPVKPNRNFLVQRMANNVELPDKTFSATKNTIRMDDAQPNTRYSVTVKLCRDEKACSSPSNELEALTPLAAPVLTKIAAGLPDTLIIDIKPETAAGVYMVFLKPSNAPSIEKELTAPATQITIGELFSNSDYVVTIKRCQTIEDNNICSKPSNQLRQKTLPGAPNRPVIGYLSEFSFVVTVTHDEFTRGKYSVTVKSQGSSTLTIPCFVAAEACPVTNLKPNTKYWVSVVICPTGSEICSAPSTEVGTKTAPKVIDAFKIASRGVDFIAVEWTKPDEMQSIIATARRNDEYDKVCTVGNLDLNSKCSIRGLTSYAQYQISITGCAEGAEGEPPVCTESAPQVASTFPEAPVEYEAVDEKFDGATVKWTAPLENGQNLVTYFINASSKDSNATANCSYELPGGCQGVCTLSGLTQTTVYQVYIKACLTNPLTEALECVDQSDTFEFVTSDQYLDLYLIFILINLAIMLFIVITTSCILSV